MWLAPLVFLISPSCSSPPSPAMPPFDTTVTMTDLMANVVDPAADVVWESVGTIYTTEGKFEKAPQTDEEWLDVKSGAITLVEIGNLLMLPSRSGGNEEWIKHAGALIAQSKIAIKATDARNTEALFNAGADIYEACVNCHKQFDPAITSVK
jgi:hypothetical protein